MSQHHKNQRSTFFSATDGNQASYDKTTQGYMLNAVWIRRVDTFGFQLESEVTLSKVQVTVTIGEHLWVKTNNTVVDLCVVKHVHDNTVRRPKT